MEWRIRRTMFIMGLASAIVAVFLTATAFYESFRVQVQKDIQLTAQIIVIGYHEMESIYELSRYANETLGITLINEQGTVLYESGSDADAMKNQSDLPEVIEALATGAGQSIRPSETTDEDYYFYAMALDDGNVLRVSMPTSSTFMMFIRVYSTTMLQILVIIIFMGVTASVFLTRSIVRPLKTLGTEIDSIRLGDGSGRVYRELVPFVQEIQAHRAEQNRMAEEKLRMAEIWHEYTVNVSHELKTPLTSISGYSELIEAGGMDEHTTRSFGGIIHREANRMLAIIRDVIFQAQVDSPEAKRCEAVDLLAIAQECAELLVLHAESYGVSVTVEGEPCPITGDREQLESMVINLLDNGIRYNVQGGSVRITVKDRSIAVEDTGIGIAPEHHAHLFERFYRVDRSRSRNTGGTGLGLPIVRSIAEKHDARVSLQSSEGKGTRITVDFT